MPPGLTALRMARLQSEAKVRHPDVVLSPTGGITGSARLTLGAFADSLHLQCATGRNPEQYFRFVGQLYAEHVAELAPAGGRSLAAIAASDAPTRSKNEQTLDLLLARFHLHGLCREHVARLVGVVWPGAYDPSVSLFVGERARLGIGKLLMPPFVPADLTSPLCSEYLQALSGRVSRDFMEHAARRCGQDAMDFVGRHTLPTITSVDHYQLHEHTCCEYVKNYEPDNRKSKGVRGQPTPQFTEWSRAAFPEFEWAEFKKNTGSARATAELVSLDTDSNPVSSLGPLDRGC